MATNPGRNPSNTCFFVWKANGKWDILHINCCRISSIKCFLKKNVMISKNCLIHFDAIMMKSLKSSLNGEYWNFQLTINPMANITVSCTDCTR